jgi:hypothetical protein
LNEPSDTARIGSTEWETVDMNIYNITTRASIAGRQRPFLTRYYAFRLLDMEPRAVGAATHRLAGQLIDGGRFVVDNAPD